MKRIGLIAICFLSMPPVLWADATSAQSIYSFDDMTVNANSPALPQSSPDWAYVPDTLYGADNLDQWTSNITGDSFRRYEVEPPPGNNHMGYPWFGFMEIDDQVAVKGHSLKYTVTGGYNATYTTTPAGLKVSNKAEYLANTQPYTDAVVGVPVIYFMAKGFYPNNNPYAVPFAAAAGANRLTLYAKAPPGSTPDTGRGFPSGIWQLGPYSKCSTCGGSGHFYNDFYVGLDGWVKIQIDDHADWNNSEYKPPAMIPGYVQNIHGFYLGYGSFEGQFMTPHNYWFDEIQFENDAYTPQNEATIYDVAVGYEPASNSWQIGFTDKYGDSSGGAKSSYQVRYAFNPITNENWNSATPAHILAYPNFHLEDRMDGSFQKSDTDAYRGVWAKFKLVSAADDAQFQTSKHIYFALKDISQDPNNLQKINPTLTGAMAGQGRDYPANPSEFYDYDVDTANLPYIKRIDYVLPGANSTPGGSLPTPTLNLPAYLPVNGNITANYPPGYSNIGFQWIITAKSGPSNNNPYSPKSAVTSRASSANFNTTSNVAGLGIYAITPGVYTVTVRATNGSATSAAASQDVTLVSADFSSMRVFPNPWRSDKHAGKSVTFDGLPLGSTVKIFTVSGHLVKTVPVNVTAASWDLTNDSGDKVASGNYLYLITIGESGSYGGSSQKARGQIVVIK